MFFSLLGLFFDFTKGGKCERCGVVGCYLGEDCTFRERGEWGLI